jgi:hypothetical protein
MHVGHKEVEYVATEEQDYEEVIEEYQRSSRTDTSDFAPTQGKPRCITLILQVFIYI